MKERRIIQLLVNTYPLKPAVLTWFVWTSVFIYFFVFLTVFTVPSKGVEEDLNNPHQGVGNDCSHFLHLIKALSRNIQTITIHIRTTKEPHYYMC